MHLLTSHHQFLQWWSTFFVFLCPSVSALLIPAWVQLKLFPCPSALVLWWQLFACEVPVRGRHCALLKKTLFDLTRFYFEGPSLKNSHSRPLCPAVPPLLIILDQKREKICRLYFHLAAWSSRWEAERVLTLCEAHRFSCTVENTHEVGRTIWAKWFLRACTQVIPECRDYLWEDLPQQSQKSLHLLWFQQ